VILPPLVFPALAVHVCSLYAYTMISLPILTHHVCQCFFDVSQYEKLFAVKQSVVVEVAGIFSLLQGTHPAIANPNALQVDVNRTWNQIKEGINTKNYPVEYLLIWQSSNQQGASIPESNHPSSTLTTWSYRSRLLPEAPFRCSTPG
jgi:hypothetical protein